MDLYAPDLAAKGIPELVESEVERFIKTYGSIVAFTPMRNRFQLVLEGAVIRLSAEVDEKGRLVSLRADQPGARGDLTEIAERIGALPGETGLLVETNGEIRAAHQADKPLAVGSAFKVAVLAALVKSAIPPSTVLSLRPEWKSLPSGILQDWPDYASLTIESFANLMISVSDNTATDVLIHSIGRNAVEQVSPRNRPFLTTREAFQLKQRSYSGDRSAWVGGDEATRRSILNHLRRQPAPLASDMLAVPTVDVEWFFTARELATLLIGLEGHPALLINPGFAAPTDWAGISYKGGSEEGVLNFSIRVTGHDGRRHCVVVTWNNRANPVDEAELMFLTQGLLYVL